MRQPRIEPRQKACERWQSWTPANRAHSKAAATSRSTASASEQCAVCKSYNKRAIFLTRWAAINVPPRPRLVLTLVFGPIYEGGGEIYEGGGDRPRTSQQRRLRAFGGCPGEMSAIGTKQTSISTLDMSAPRGKADIG